MSFTSWQYAFFLPVVALLYWRLPLKGRMLLVLVSSYVFYGAWDARFLALLMTSTCIDFFGAQALAGIRRSLRQVAGVAALPLAWLSFCTLTPWVEGTIDATILGTAAGFPVVFTALYAVLWRLPEAKQKKGFLLLGILSNLAVLGFFKYFNFFGESLLGLLGAAGMDPGWTLPHVILPIAISFYTFQSVAYSVDVYRGRATPCQSWLTFSAYLAYFPQLVAGPIERANHLMPQFLQTVRWDWSHVHFGLRLLLVGAFKKVFVADNCAILANYAFDPATELNAPWAILGVLAFAFQIYGDFSGYTDLARGSARLMGIDLSENFHLPYSARGPSDFWQRWHMTLSSWFRDYVYIPLGGNRRGSVRTVFNLWVTMLLAGLWHGAAWTFVLWGAFHAALLTLYRVVSPLGDLESDEGASRGKRALGVAVMFSFTLVGWAIFRAADLPSLMAWFKALGNWEPVLDWVKPSFWLLLHAGPLLLLQWATGRQKDEAQMSHFPWGLRGLVYWLMFMLVAGSVSSDQEFIYFQF